MLDANTRQIIGELNGTIAELSGAIDRLCFLIDALRLENGRLKLELQPDMIDSPFWLPAIQA